MSEQLLLAEISRYERHFPVIGLEGQLQLKQARVICIGCGGLGSVVLQFLTAAGVGTLGCVDYDDIEMNNLHRQILYNEDNIGQSKVEVATSKLKKQNPHIKFNIYPVKLSEENIAQIMSSYDIVVDASDNYFTRYLLNKTCFDQAKPLVSASVSQWSGQCSVFNYENGPCYCCLYPKSLDLLHEETCESNGVLGILPGILGTLQAMEVIKIIVKQGKILTSRLIVFNALDMQWKEFKLEKNPYCEQCSTQGVNNLLDDSSLSFDQRPHLNENSNHLVDEISPQELLNLLENNHSIQLLDIREDYERKICDIGGVSIPMSTFKMDLLPFKKSEKLIVYCKLGSRSRSITKLLKTHGFKNVCSLEGGIMAWIEEVDSSLSTY